MTFALKQMYDSFILYTLNPKGTSWKNKSNKGVNKPPNFIQFWVYFCVVLQTTDNGQTQASMGEAIKKKAT